MNITQTRLKMLKLCRIGIFTAALFLGTNAVNAQLSGNYTIDKSSPASSTNFTSFQSFADTLTVKGVSGPVSVSVSNGPYNEQVAFKSFSGASSTNTVTINGNNQRVYYAASSSSSKHTIMLDDADYMIFDQLTVEGTGGTYGYGFFLKGQADNNVIKNCTVKLPNINNNAYYYYSQSYNDGAANIMIAATPSSCPLYYYYDYGAYGQNGRNNIIEKNVLTGGESGNTGPMYGIYEAGEIGYPATYQTNNIIRNNSISNFYMAGIVSYFTDGSQITGNEIFRTEDINGQYYAQLYGIFSILNNAQDQDFLISNNNIHHLDGADAPQDYSYPAWIYGIYFEEMYASSYKPIIDGNYVHHNKAGSDFYGMFAYGLHEGDITNNIFSTNIGYYGAYEIQFYYPDNSNFVHNTIYTEDVKNYSPYYYYGIYAYHYTSSNSKIVGNNVSSIMNGSANYAMYLGETEQYWTEVDYNNFYVNGYTPIDLNGSQMSITDFGNQTGWKGNKEVDAKLADPANDDFRTLSFKLNNKVPSLLSLDYEGNSRNPILSDIGAVEVYTDLQTDSFQVGNVTTVCGGYSVKPQVTFTNNFADDAEDIQVSVKVGTGNIYSETIAGPVSSGSTYTYTFDKEIEFHNPGNNVVWGGVNIPDDNTANDTIFNIINVKPSPDGSSYTSVSTGTKAFYQLGKSFDVTIVDEPVIYNLNAPTDFNNAGYGTNWSATSWAATSGGILRPSAEISTTIPTGGNDYQVSWETSDLSIEDTVIWLYTKVTDLNNGCDTTIKRQVLLYPKIRPSVMIDNLICDGEEIFFDNTSSVRSGGMEFKWVFDINNPSSDTSDATSPVYAYSGPGTYYVKMVGKTIPYGFESELIDTVEINPIPNIGFTRQNACEGNAVILTNTTTPASPTSYTWNFGDGSPTANTTNASKTYAMAGQYKVTLTANLNGCISTKSATVYQFATPTADFTVNSGVCSNEEVVFQNTSTLASGNLGSYWDFDDNGNVSTNKNPTYLYGEGGAKNVLLKAISEFGCRDSITKTVLVKQAPMTSFTNTPTCSNTPTEFTNTTDMGGESVATINWTFDSEGSSTANNPQHSWSSIGPKKVTLKVSAMNGCSEEISKNVIVGIQPLALFEAGNVCAGDQAIFVNKSSSVQGEMEFYWEFGDSQTSTVSNPVVIYNNVTATTTFNVTLTAKVQGGCENRFTKQVTVFEAPKHCDFDYDVRYDRGFYGVVFKPKTAAGAYGTQNGVTYTWIYAGEGQETITGDGTASESKFGFHDFQTEGPYQVTLRARESNNGCECTSTNWVTINRSDVKNSEMQTINAYPNPSNGIFTLELNEGFGNQVKLEVYNSAGKLVKSLNVTNTGNTGINLSDLSQGLYNVRITGAEQVAMAKLVIQ